MHLVIRLRPPTPVLAVAPLRPVKPARPPSDATEVEANGDRPSYFVLTYDRATSQVLSLSGHGHDFTGAVLTLTARLQYHRHHPSVAVRLLVASDLPDLLDRHGELFEGLTFQDG